MIVFRVFSTSTSGLGHIVRCRYLAQALQQQNQEVVFICDQLNTGTVEFLADYTTHYLYPSEPDHWDNEVDAQATLGLLESHQLSPDWLVVDHYFLEARWERQIAEAGFKVFAIDDLVRPHYCDALLDFKWRGPNPEAVYRDQVLGTTQLLLGPQYCFLPPQLTLENDTEAAADLGNYVVLVSLGGGGDANILVQLLTELIEFSHRDKEADVQKSISIQVVIGPLMQNREALKQFSHFRSPTMDISFIEGQTSLDAELKLCDLYVGVAGGTVYALRALKKPAITFSLAENQQTDQALLDAIGHYFHLNHLEDGDFAKLAKWVFLCRQNQQRIQQLFASSEIAIDTLGADRVADFMLSGQIYQLPKPKKMTHQWTELAGGRRLRAVNDADLNHYLASRNLPENCQNMLDINPIRLIDHVLWWFNVKRHSFLMTKTSGDPLLYIWDELKQVEDQSFLIGGWFVCDASTAFQEAMVALDWQLKHCESVYPNVPWVAVISRENKYVKLMNDYFGFKEIEPGGRYYKAVTTLFPKASPQDFYYVYKV